jgi:hypothetical protein
MGPEVLFAPPPVLESPSRASRTASARPVTHAIAGAGRVTY